MKFTPQLRVRRDMSSVLCSTLSVVMFKLYMPLSKQTESDTERLSGLICLNLLVKMGK